MRGLPEFPVQGGCLCGAVRFSLMSAPKAVYRCHCKDCQRISNGTHTVSMIVKSEHVQHLCGELAHYDKQAESGRTVRLHRCAVCGTHVWHAPLAAHGVLVLKSGNLDDQTWARPVGNIWTASATPWEAIDPAGPNFAGQPPSRDALIAAWTDAHA